MFGPLRPNMGGGGGGLMNGMFANSGDLTYQGSGLQMPSSGHFFDPSAAPSLFNNSRNDMKKSSIFDSPSPFSFTSNYDHIGGGQ
jgi:hypothetical protein